MINRPVRSSDSAATLVRIILQSMNGETSEVFIRRLTNDFPPDMQVKLYDFAVTMIQSWAGQADLSRKDAAVIEDCRKICDVMGWPQF